MRLETLGTTVYLVDDETGNRAQMTPEAVNAWNLGGGADIVNLPSSLLYQKAIEAVPGTDATIGLAVSPINEFSDYVIHYAQDIGWVTLGVAQSLIMRIWGTVPAAITAALALNPWLFAKMALIIAGIVLTGYFVLWVWRTINGRGRWSQLQEDAQAVIDQIEAIPERAASLVTAAGKAYEKVKTEAGSLMDTITEPLRTVYGDAKGLVQGANSTLWLGLILAGAVLLTGFGTRQLNVSTMPRLQIVGKSNPRRNQKRNPPVGRHGEKIPTTGFLPGYATELRYQRRGPSQGYYYHKFTTKPAIRVNRNGSVTLVPRRGVQLYEMGPA